MVIMADNLLHRLVGQPRNEKQEGQERQVGQDGQEWQEGQVGQEGYGMAGQQAHLFWQALA